MSISNPDPNDTAYVQLPITTDADTLADGAIAYIQSIRPDYIPEDGDPEVVTIESHSQAWGAALQLAAQMPPAALSEFGQKLLGIPLGLGTPATATITFTMLDDTGGYTIDAGSQLIIDTYAFNVLTDIVSVAGSAMVTGVVTATESDSDYNGLIGTSITSLSLPSYVEGMSLAAPTEGGIDPQDPNDYLNDISEELTLTSRATITLPNYEAQATAIDGILRAHAVTTDAREVTVWLLSDALGIVSDTLKDELSAIYASTRLVNVTVALDDPSFNTINVVWEITAYQGYDVDDITARVNQALTTELSPAGYGAVTIGDPGNIPTQWYNETSIKAQRLATVISQVQGVYDVTNIVINTHTPWTDFLMTGTVPLPNAGTLSGTVDFIS